MTMAALRKLGAMPLIPRTGLLVKIPSTHVGKLEAYPTDTPSSESIGYENVPNEWNRRDGADSSAAGASSGLIRIVQQGRRTSVK